VVSTVARFTSADEDPAKVADAMRLLTVASRQEEGFIRYIPQHLEGDPNIIVISEQYRDDAALAAHPASTHFKKHAVERLFQKMKDSNREDLNALV
jgi:quinol monooxygenase YgiN